MEFDVDRLIAAATAAREKAYAPYSGFKVGAAVVTASGEMFRGCNVENLSYGLANCAERVAIGSAVAAGEREFAGLVVVADTREPVSPCGACRQVMVEFGDFPLVLATLKGVRFETTVGEMLPRGQTGILDRE
ncbi:MAG: cytidine deaminase [Verrucomicrobiales bacterium]